MRFLIDTQILVWSLGLSDKLPNRINELISDKTNEIYASSVSIWEIAIKKSIGKLTFPFELTNIIPEINGMNINILDIRIEHFLKVSELPFHHKDPFDRLIISQGMVEKLPIISSDNYFKNYDIKIIW